MLVELIISWVDIWTFIILIITLLVMATYTFFTYKIAYEKKTPRISFGLSDIRDSIGHIKFEMVNLSPVDSEVWCKVRTKVEGHTFSDKGFYGDKSPWVLQALMRGNGHFRLGNLESSESIKLKDVIDEKKINSIKLDIQIRYRAIGGKIWKKSPVLNYIYDFKQNLFWLDV